MDPEREVSVVVCPEEDQESPRAEDIEIPGAGGTIEHARVGGDLEMMELTPCGDLHAQKLPGKPNSSVPPNPTQNSEDSPPRHFLPQLSDSSGASTNNDSDTSTRGKTWLQAPTDFLRNQVKKYTASPILNETDIESPRVSKVEGGESMIEKADRVFTVSSRDVSMLERISQRARDRAIQIQRPHEVFVELEEIRMDPSDELEWAETARWIKFEEEVEEGSGRWGRPHISALAFHSLIELKKGLDRGSILLDVKGSCFLAIVDEIVANVVESGGLAAECADQVRMLLLKKHKHTNDTTLWEKIKNSATDGTLHQIGEGLRKKNVGDSAHLLPTQQHDNDPAPVQTPTLSHVPLLFEEDEEKLPDVPPSNSTPSSVPPTADFEPPQLLSPSKKVSFLSPPPNTSGYITSSSGSTHSSEQWLDVEKAELASESSTSSLRNRRRGSTIISKIPDEAESLTVLVGGVSFLDRPITAFVRLGEGLVLGDLVEAPVPVRFIFLLIGPDNDSIDYHETGRAMATLMSDAHFHEVAYSAKSKEDLINAMDKFLDNSLVLPPGDWGEDLLLPALHERNHLRKKKEDHKLAVESYNKMVTSPLKHSRRPCGGMWRDFKHLISRYPSDFTDACTPQVFISIIFLYISFLAPAIAFGGLMEEVTGNLIGETETLFATGLGGVLYGLFSVQPLTVLAFTGPVLVFESIILEYSQMFNFPYVEWRFMIGLWLMVILLVLAVSELTFLVHHFTRFCEEVFTGIVAVFFIYEACLSLFHIYERNPLCGLNYPCGKVAHYSNTCVPLDDHYDNGNLSNGTNMTTDDMAGSGMVATTVMMAMKSGNVTPTLPRGFRICNQPNTTLWCLILALSTFVIALLLRKLRFKNFLGKKTRRLVSDFGMLTAITTMVIISYLLRNLVTVEVLLVAPNYGVSNSTARGWIVNPFNGSLSIGAGFGALIPALLLSILIFVENQLALILVNKPENKLVKPVGYHIDLSLVALMAGVSGVFGIPFMCGAPVRSIQHMQALSVFTKKHAPGEKPKLLKVHEQRVATLIVHILIILTPLAYPVLEAIPISVVLGVFFYLAYASIGGVQLFTRIKLLFILPKHHPDVIYVRKVRTWKMHIYTLLQVCVVAVLYGLKLSPAAIVYPLVIVMLIPLRWFLGKTLYNKDEIEALDNEENAKSKDGEDIGEFAVSHVPY